MKLTTREIANHKPKPNRITFCSMILFPGSVCASAVRRGPGYFSTSSALRPTGSRGDTKSEISRRWSRQRLARLPRICTLGCTLATIRQPRKSKIATKRATLSASSSQAYLGFKETELREGSYDQVRRHLQTNVKSLHGLPLSSIDQRIIADRLNAVAKASGAVTANRTRASLSALYAWGMGEGLAPSNPVASTAKRTEQSARAFQAMPNCARVAGCRGNNHGKIAKLLLATAQRRGEIGGLRWSEIDLDKNLISLPPERTKNAKLHELPITDTVRSIIQSQPKTEGRDFLFGYGEGAFSGWSRAKDTLDEAIANSGNALPPFTLHDLRRTVATKMADIGVPPHVIEAVLNHTSGQVSGIAGIYNRALYTAEKAQALARWDSTYRHW